MHGTLRRFVGAGVALAGLSVLMVSCSQGSARGFGVALSPALLNVVTGHSGTTTVTIDPATEFNGTLHMSLVDAGGLPIQGVILRPDSVAVQGGTAVAQAVEVDLAGTALPLSAIVELRVSNGTLTQSAALALQITYCGTLSSAVSYPVGVNPSSVAVGDFNGDGRPDIVTSNTYANDVSVLLAQ
ncbi:MAG: VCBS repeat-containing protein [Deinococcales bacterium]